MAADASAILRCRFWSGAEGSSITLLHPDPSSGINIAEQRSWPAQTVRPLIRAEYGGRSV